MDKPKPAIRPTDASKPFWDATAAGQFLLQNDTETGRTQFFPRPLSLSGEGTLDWRPAAGTGTLIAVSTVRVPAPGFESETPYRVGIVALGEGPRVFAPIRDVGPEGIAPGARVKIVWQEHGDVRLYAFAPAREQTGKQG